MRNIVSAFAGLALLAGVSSMPAVAADGQTAIAFTAGQGGSMTVLLPPANQQPAIVSPTQTVAVTAGQGGNITIVVPAPSLDVVAKSAAAKPGPQVTLLTTEGIN